MKKTQEILGLPIISISEGIEVGRVKNVIVNAVKGAIDYVVVESGIQILSAKVIPTENVIGIGEYALTIENEEAINDLSKIPAAINLLQKNIQVIGTKVLTQKGRLIGEIGDIYVDENEKCKIIGLEYIADITQKKIRIIPRESVITFGSNLVVVKENVESYLLDKPSELNLEKGKLENEKKNSMNFYQSTDVPEDIISEVDKILENENNSYFKKADSVDNEIKSKPYEDNKGKLYNNEMGKMENEPLLVEDIEKSFLNQDKIVKDIKESEASEEDKMDNLDPIEDVEENEIEAIDNTVFYQETQGTDIQENTDVFNQTKPQGSASSLFEQRQKQYLNGRKVTKTISNNAGAVIINEGNTITEEIIEMAKDNGKLIELVMNNKA
ncbi:UNVERIFIED_CONTAM: uncharacterized protein YrrD [Acetivibrio alkalicellulosi]